MILVDTSVWIDNVRDSKPELQHYVEANAVLCHAMVIGELACGNLPQRGEFLDHVKALPRIETTSMADLLAMIEDQKWMGRGIGYVDANLLASVLVAGNATLWTNDLRLRRIAEELGVAHIPEEDL